MTYVAKQRKIGQTRRRPRVLIQGINYAPELTGIGRYSGEIGAYLAQHGADVDVVTAVPHYPGWFVRDGFRNSYSVERDAGIRITRCPLILNTEMRGIWRLLAPLSYAVTSAPVVIWRILQTRPGTVLCVEPTLLSAPAALFAAKLVGARTVLHVQDLEIDAAFAFGYLKSGLAQKFAAWAEMIILKSFDMVVTISGRMQDHLTAKGVAPERTDVVRNWIDLEKVKPLAGMSPYRLELGLGEDSFVALYSGNIGTKQALPIVLAAAEQLAGETSLVFVVAGDGPEKRRLIERYGHLANVRFLPVQPEARLCDLLNLADVHLLPQDNAIVDLVLPSKLGGMLASGKPCIVMANPGTELFDFLGDGAVIVPPGESGALAAAIQRMLHEPGHHSVANNSARLAKLDVQQNLSKFLGILTPGCV